jgi:hypothetical protein
LNKKIYGLFGEAKPNLDIELYKKDLKISSGPLTRKKR